MDRDRLSVLLGGVAIGLALGALIQLPTRRVGLNVFGSRLGVDLSTPWMVTAFAVGLAVAGAHAVLDPHPHYRKGDPTISWILPGLTALVTGALLAQTESMRSWLAVMVLGIVALGLVTANEYRSLDPSERERSAVDLVTASAVYGLALALLVLICAARSRTLLSGPAVFAVSGLLSLRLFWSTGQQLRRAVFYGGIIGLIVSQAMWALNYWIIRPLPGGLLLLLIFYLATGITHQSLLNQMSRRVLIEYGAITLAAAAVVLIWVA
jgi:hypothetical protein